MLRQKNIHDFMQALNQRVQLGQILSEELFEFCTVPSICQNMILKSPTYKLKKYLVKIEYLC